MRRLAARGAVLGLLVTAALAGCSGASAPTASTGSLPSMSASASQTTSTGSSAAKAAQHGSARVVRTVATGLATPWGIAFLPDGTALVGERDTARLLLVGGSGGARVIGTVPGVDSNGLSGGEAGLLGLAVSPTFPSDHLVYAYLSGPSDNRIVRMTYSAGLLGAPTPIVTGIPRGLHHNGGRLVFGPDGMLYASTGESGDPVLAQDKGSLGGKILRMTPAGRPAPRNPFAGSLVLSYGHRNVEGLAFDGDQRLWATEFGDKAYDELNLVEAGRDYGWPDTQGVTDDTRYTSPAVQWRTSSAGPSGIAIREGVAWIGALTGTRLYRVALDGSRATSSQSFFDGTYGRIRTVVLAPDGNLWVTTSNRDGRGDPAPGDDRILEVTVT